MKRVSDENSSTAFSLCLMVLLQSRKKNGYYIMTFFNESTTEHEQDGFIAWMCANFNNSLDTPLQRLSKKFIDFLITPSGGTSFVADYQVVKVERQKYNIDVLLTLKEGDSTHYVIIEDKIDSQEHGEQLIKYVKRLKKEKDVTEESRILVVYYKTGHIIKSDGELTYDSKKKRWIYDFSFGEYHRVLDVKDKATVGLNIVDLESIKVFFCDNKQLVSDCYNAIVSDYVDYIKGRYDKFSYNIVDAPAFVWIKAFDDFVCAVKEKNQLHDNLSFKVTAFTASDPELQITWGGSEKLCNCKYPVMCIHSKDLCSDVPFIRFQNKRGTRKTAKKFVNPILSKTGDQIMKFEFQYGQFSNNALNSITIPFPVNDIHKLLAEICNRYCDVVNGKANNFYL